MNRYVIFHLNILKRVCQKYYSFEQNGHVLASNGITLPQLRHLLPSVFSSMFFPFITNPIITIGELKTNNKINTSGNGDINILLELSNK